VILDYDNHLKGAEELTDFEQVTGVAMVLGESEDFDGLVSALEEVQSV